MLFAERSERGHKNSAQTYISYQQHRQDIDDYIDVHDYFPSCIEIMFENTFSFSSSNFYFFGHSK